MIVLKNIMQNRNDKHWCEFVFVLILFCKSLIFKSSNLNNLTDSYYATEDNQLHSLVIYYWEALF